MELTGICPVVVSLMDSGDMPVAGDKLHDIVEKARAAGFIYVFALTGIDELVSAAIFNRVFSKNDIEVVVTLDPRVVEEPAVFIGVDEVPGFRGSRFIVEERNGCFSYSTVKALEEIWIVGNKPKLMALVGCVARGVDRGANGFEGLEDLVEELRSENIIDGGVGFRLWVDEATSYVDALSNTIVPYMPGLTGDRVAAESFVKRVVGIDDPGNVSFHEEFMKMDSGDIKHLVAGITEMITSRYSVDPMYLVNILGKIFWTSVFPKNPYLTKIYGVLLTYLSVDSASVYRIPFLARFDNVLTEMFFAYSYMVSVVAEEAASNINQYYVSRQPVFSSHYIRRPEIYVEALRFLGWLPENEPIVIETGDGYYTVLSELIRVYGKIDTAYAFDDRQMVEVRGL